MFFSIVVLPVEVLGVFSELQPRKLKISVDEMMIDAMFFDIDDFGKMNSFL